MAMRLPPGDLIAAIDQNLVDILQKIADDAPDKDSDIHAVIVLRRTPNQPGDPKLYVDVNAGGCTELVATDVVDGYPPIAPVKVDRLDYASAMVYQSAFSAAGAQAVAARSCWYVVGGRRYHCV